MVREQIGPVAAFKQALVVEAAAEDALGQDPARHHGQDRRRRGLQDAGDDRRSGDPRRDCAVAAARPRSSKAQDSSDATKTGGNSTRSSSSSK
jgi:hypothetical protein